MSDNLGLTILYILSYGVPLRWALVNVVMRCGITPHVMNSPFHTASLSPLSVQYTTPFTDPSKNLLEVNDKTI